MPVTTEFRATAPAGQGLTETVVRSTLLRLCRKTVETLRQVLLQELNKRLSQAEISDEVKERWRAFTRFDELILNYQSCFQIQDTAEGAVLKIDRDRLETLGLPRELPELLEYGSEIGISPLAHFRTGWQKFLNQTVPKLAEETIRELV